MAGRTPEHRSAREVFEDHLRTRKNGALDDDALRNYADQVVLLTRRGVFRGHDGVRELGRTLQQEGRRVRPATRLGILLGRLSAAP